jgi:hypothetical protein
MILQVIVPQKETYDLKVSFPKDYVGKQVHCLFYIEEEVKNNAPITMLPKKKPSDFFGTMSREEGEKMQAYMTQNRNEWDRNI